MDGHEQPHQFVGRLVGPELNAFDDSGKVFLHKVAIDVLYHTVHVRAASHQCAYLCRDTSQDVLVVFAGTTAKLLYLVVVHEVLQVRGYL